MDSGNCAPVVALAGRRIDAVDAECIRFPLHLVSAVRERIIAAFEVIRPMALVCSAACGADLIALEIAQTKSIPFYIVLPFDRTRFKKTSVVDRPGPWGDIFDRLIEEAEQLGRLSELVGVDNDDQAYSKATEAIVQKAKEVADGSAAVAIAVIDDNRRSSFDATAELVALASRAGFEIGTIEIPTLPRCNSL